MTAYAMVEGTEGLPSDIKKMAQESGSNIFAVQADCRQDFQADDFLKSELGSSLKKGLDQVIQRLKEAGLLGDQNDPNAGKPEGMNIVRGMADLIPIMARMVSFETEDEVLQQEGDVYFLGRFFDFQSVSMCAQAFSLLYQFRYREQERTKAKNAIEELLSQIETKVEVNENFIQDKENLEKKLFGTYIPAILYSRADAEDHKKSIDRFKKFMTGYRFPADVEDVVTLADKIDLNKQEDIRKFELTVNKIIALSKEDFMAVATITEELKKIP
jgi:HEPN domain-containing protein